MTNILNHDSFSQALDSEIIWRRKEISDIKRAIKDAPSVSKNSLLRAFLPLLYAHWEGSTIGGCKLFFKYITIKKVRLSDLSPHFGNLVFLKRLDALSNSRVSLSEKLKLLSEIRSVGTLRLSRLPDDLIETGANLNCARMRSICLLCNVDSSFLDESEDLIDIQILRRRNQIAHGEWASIEESELDNLTNSLFDLITAFRNELENSVVEERFRRVA